MNEEFVIKPKLSIVVALTKRDAAVGNGGELLFRISDDLKRFRRITLHHPVILGRKTFQSIGMPLPERANIIVTRDKNFKADGALIAHSIEDALRKAGEIDKDEIFVIGGGEIYKQALPIVDKLYLTIVESEAVGDIFFPDWHKDFTKETFREERFDENTSLKYTWLDLEKG